MDVEAWIAQRGGSELFRVVADEAPCGYVEIAANIDPCCRSGWLGMAAVPSQQQKGKDLLLREFMLQIGDQLGLRKILLKIRADNAGAIALYRSASYRGSGVLRERFFDGSTRHNVRLMEDLLEGNPR